MLKRTAWLLALVLLFGFAYCMEAGIVPISSGHCEEEPSLLTWKTIRGSNAYGQFGDDGMPNGFIVMESKTETTYGIMNNHIKNRNCWDGTCVYLSRDDVGQIEYIGILSCSDGKIEKAHCFYTNGDIRYMDLKTTKGIRYENKGGEYIYAETNSKSWGLDKTNKRQNIPEWADIFYSSITVAIDEAKESFQQPVVLSGQTVNRETVQGYDVYHVNITPQHNETNESCHYYGSYTIDGITEDGQPVRLLWMRVEKNGNVEIQWKNKTWSYEAASNEFHPATDGSFETKTQEDIRICKQVADEGNAEAQYTLGLAYLSGDVTARSTDLAVEYLTLAAQQDYGKALFTLATMYETGNAVAQDAEKARQYYFAAVKQNNSEALYTVGKAFSQMKNNSKNRIFGIDCLRKAARQLNPDALYLMATMYESGDGLEKSSQLAFLYYVAAADNGAEQAQYLVAKRYYYGEGVDKSASKALPYFEKAAELGNVNAQYYAGLIYYFGDSGYQSSTKAAYYFQLAADQGDMFSQNWIGEMYYFGNGVEQSYELAAAYFSLSADQGYDDAQYKLGMMYMNGLTGSGDYKKAEEYLKKAADQKYRKAYEALGDLFSESSYGMVNIEQAISYYQIAADLGSAHAKERIEALKETK